MAAPAAAASPTGSQIPKAPAGVKVEDMYRIHPTAMVCKDVSSLDLSVMVQHFLSSTHVIILSSRLRDLYALCDEVK